MAALSMSEEGAYGLGKAAPQKKNTTQADTAPRNVFSILPEWAWGLVAVGGIALISGTVYFLTSKGKRS